MADVTLTYKGDTIAELSETGSKTLETAGKYCEDDILLEYAKSSGLADNVKQTVIIPQSDISVGKTATFETGIILNSKVVVFALSKAEFPQPPSSGYLFLSGAGYSARDGGVSNLINATSLSILRSNGTIGTGTIGEVSFNPSNGVLAVSPSYGAFLANEEYTLTVSFIK